MYVVIFKSILMILSLVLALCISYIMAMVVLYIIGVVLSALGITNYGNKVKTCSYNMGRRIKSIIKIKSKE